MKLYRLFTIGMIVFLACRPALAQTDSKTAGSRLIGPAPPPPLEAPTPPATSEIRWQNGVQVIPQWSASQTHAAIAQLSRRSEERHFVVQLSEPPGNETREALAQAGVRLLAPLGNGAYHAGVDGPVETDRLTGIDSLVHAGPLEPRFKLHPDLGAEAITPAWALRVDERTGQERLICVARLHDDVDVPSAIAKLEELGATIHDSLQAIEAVVFDVPTDRVEQVTALDEVRWLEPPLPALKAGNFEAAIATNAAPVRNVPGFPPTPYDLDGSGISVMVYDTGEADPTHADLQGRLFVMDMSGVDPTDPFHPTHVSGTIAGSGRLNSMNAGMAPGATILSYGFLQDGTFNDGDLHLNPGDLEADFRDAFANGADVANASLHAAPAVLFPPQCQFLGAYGITSQLIDQLVIGDDESDPMRIVWITGNDRGVGTCGSTYRTISPPGTAKNCITVGSFHTDNADPRQWGPVSEFSGWGPSGQRIKPDLIAPGCEVGPPGAGINSTIDGDAYDEFCGTSQAAPVVTGCVALLLEDMADNEPGFEPLNSTIKALLINSATSIGFSGPNYREGWGRVDIRAAIDTERDRNWVEGTLDAGVGDRRTYYLDVPPSPPAPFLLKATLAWDDVPAPVGTNGALVNDLDLLLFDPSGDRVGVWKLNPAVPQAVATQEPVNVSDRINNVEQAQAGLAFSSGGLWRVEVRAFGSLVGDQSFSVVTNVPMIHDCNGNGVEDADEVAAGTTPDCNGNGFPDSCDIARGFADDCNGNGVPDRCDITSGEEFDCDRDQVPDSCDPSPGLSVDCNGDGTPDVCDITSGADQDCDDNMVADSCQLAAGVSQDCNENGVLDECDIDSGTEGDCDGDGVPDSCEILEGTALDCNNNGVPDACDLSSGGSLDCNVNGVPDECDLATGSSDDVNDNGIPDECLADGDCNGNRTPDVLEILGGRAYDCDGDWIIDSCERLPDCNDNEIPDLCEVTDGTARDDDENLVPDECQNVLMVPSVYPTLQAALDAAVDGDEIRLEDGTYSGPGFENLDVSDRVVSLTSVNGAAATAIDLSLSGAEQRFLSLIRVDERTRVVGISVRNAQAGANTFFGGAIEVSNASPRFIDCVFEDNEAVQWGGAVALFSASGPRFTGCSFSGNHASLAGGAVVTLTDPAGPTVVFESCVFQGNTSGSGGGAVLHFAGATTLIGCTFEGNSAVNSGGAFSSQGGTVTLDDCEVRNNSASRGGGLWLQDTDSRILRCLIRDNAATDGTPQTVGGGIGLERGSSRIQYCRLKNNAVTRTTTGSAWGGGVGAWEVTSFVLRDSLVSGNTVTGVEPIWSSGGGVMVGGQQVEILGSTIADNLAGRIGGVSITDASFDGVEAVIESSILWGNTALDGFPQVFGSSGTLDILYSNVQGGEADIGSFDLTLSYGPGNLDVDPLFADTSIGNYHLQAFSPCINRGNPDFVPEPDETDYDGHRRVMNGRIDQGADERPPIVISGPETQTPVVRGGRP
ncbi:MAG: S8 family serine peptidase [Acidobacteriota bacterium]